MVGIVILNYNNYEDTINCIESVEKYNSAPVKYVVVDNGSSNDQAVPKISQYLVNKFAGDCEILEDQDTARLAKMKRVTFLVSKSNSGYAQGNNKGLKLLENDEDIDNILILNNDILFVEDIISKLIQVQQIKQDCGVVSPILFKRNMSNIDYNCARLNHNAWEIILTYLFLHRDPFDVLRKMSDNRRLLIKTPGLLTEEIVEIELPSGSCMLIKKDLFSKIGWFDPNTFLYFEENILYKKLNALKLKNYLITDCKCIHLGAMSTSRANNELRSMPSMKSSKYYLENYTNLNTVQYAVMKLAFSLAELKIKLKNIITINHE